MKSILFGFNLIFTSTLIENVDDNFKIGKTSKTVTIDGNLSEQASIPNAAVFTNHKNRPPDGYSVFSQMMRNNNNFYIAFTVTDSDITLFDNDDLIEIFFDFDG